MVDDAPDTPPEQVPPEKPFAIRSVVYTIGFLAVVLGVVPSLFHIPLAAGEGFWAKAGTFWESLRVLVGVTVFAAGLTSYSLCSAWLIFHGRGPHVEFDPPKTFVANGPYRWVRNPVVLCLLLTVAGEAIYLASVGITLLLLVGMPLAHYQVTRIEEPRLRERFGASYDDYCRRVPRWCPRPPKDDAPATGE